MLSELNSFISKVAGYRVLVIGETIQDEFVQVAYEGHSMKSNCPVIRLHGEKTLQQGGAAAIANHLRDFVSNVTLISNPQNAIVKTRFVDVDDRRKHIEINYFDSDSFQPIEFNPADYDLVRQDDYVDILGFENFNENSNLKIRLKHSDGTADTFDVLHGYNAQQAEWLLSGSALNKIREELNV